MPDVITASEYLVINSVPLATPAWRITDLTPLWSGADLRGRDRVKPGAEGATPVRRVLAATRLVLPGVVFGTHNREGTPYGDVRTGLRTNLDVLHTQVVDPPAGDGTHAATWVLPGTDKTADVHVVGFSTRAFSPAAVRFTIELSIPSGRFT